jgi:RNA polymerase sigma-70 factor (ECF subfamily)
MKAQDSGSLHQLRWPFAQVGDPAAGLAAIEEIPANRVASYQPYWAAYWAYWAGSRASLQSLNRQDEARHAFARAASLTDAPAMREYLFKRASVLYCINHFAEIAYNTF